MATEIVFGAEKLPSADLPCVGQGPDTLCVGRQACKAVCNYIQNIQNIKNDPSIYVDMAINELHGLTTLPEGVDRKVVQEIEAGLEEDENKFWEGIGILANPNPEVPKCIIEETAIKMLARPEIKVDCEENVAQVALLIARARRAGNNGLYLDDQMKNIGIKSATELRLGRHALFYGDPGIAKTELAKHVAGAIDPGYKFVSLAAGHDDTLVSKTTVEDGTIVEKLGIIAQAAVNGNTIVIEEINSVPTEYQSQLNTLLVAKAGDTITLSTGQEVTIATGFRVIGTLNPVLDNQGNVRLQANQLSDSLVERFRIFEFLPSMIYARCADAIEVEDYSATLMSLLQAKAYTHGGIIGLLGLFEESQRNNVLQTLQSVYELQLKALPSENHSADMPHVISDRSLVGLFESWLNLPEIIRPTYFSDYVKGAICQDVNNRLTPAHKQAIHAIFQANVRSSTDN